MPLRDYQQEAVRRTFNSLRLNQSCILQMPTGSGKTHVAMDIISRGLKHGRRVNFCVDTLTLVDQTLDRFYEAGFSVGVMQGDHPLYRPHAPVQVVSLQTLARRDRKNWPDGDLWIVDECHTQYEVMRKAIQDYTGRKFLGLTATPFATGMGLVWNDLVVATTTGELIKRGYLCDYVAYGPQTPDLTGMRYNAGDYAANDAAERMAPLTGNLVLHYLKHAAGKKAIVFSATVEHAKALAHEFNRAGVEADYVHGHDSDERRQRVMERYRNNEFKVLCNCAVLIKGYDQPDIEVEIIARPTKSLSLHIQMLGRVLRPFEGKTAMYFDHAGNIARLGLPDDPLPQELCMKEKGVSSMDKREKTEPLPWNCPKCHHLNPAKTPACTVCGHRTPPKFPETADGVLVEYVKERELDQQQVFAMLNRIGKERGFKPGWAYVQFKELFGSVPDWIDRSAVAAPTPEMEAIISDKLERFRRHQWARGAYGRR